MYVQSLGFKLQWIRIFDYLRLLSGAIRILVPLFAIFVLQSSKSMQFIFVHSFVTLGRSYHSCVRAFSVLFCDAFN